MVDLTDAEIDALEECAEALREEMQGYYEDPDWGSAHPEAEAYYRAASPDVVLSLIAEVRRWRDQAADEAGLARLAAEIGRLADSVDRLGQSKSGGWEGYGERDAPPGWIMRSVGSPGGAHAPKEERSE